MLEGLHWTQILSYASVVLFVYAVICVALAYLKPLSMQMTRFVAVSGMSSLAVLTTNCCILYYWHMYLR